MSAKEFIKKNGYYIKIGAIFVAVILILYIFDIPCIFRYFFGLSCPGCGMSRAFLSAIKLDFATAFYYHPLWVLVPLLVAIEAVSLIKGKYKLATTVIIVFFLCMMAVWTYRMFFTDTAALGRDVRDGLIWRLINK